MYPHISKRIKLTENHPQHKKQAERVLTVCRRYRSDFVEEELVQYLRSHVEARPSGVVHQVTTIIIITIITIITNIIIITHAMIFRMRTRRQRRRTCNKIINLC